jgi:hypothetical protein
MDRVEMVFDLSSLKDVFFTAAASAILWCALMLLVKRVFFWRTWLKVVFGLLATWVLWNMPILPNVEGLVGASLIQTFALILIAICKVMILAGYVLTLISFVTSVAGYGHSSNSSE